MSDESTLPYNGPLSTTTEWHASIYGFTFGFVVGLSKPMREQIPKEAHYAFGFGLIGLYLGYRISQDSKG